MSVQFLIGLYESKLYYFSMSIFISGALLLFAFYIRKKVPCAFKYFVAGLILLLLEDVAGTYLFSYILDLYIEKNQQSPGLILYVIFFGRILIEIIALIIILYGCMFGQRQTNKPSQISGI